MVVPLSGTRGQAVKFAHRGWRVMGDWHHLIDLCALAGALVIDPDGAYDPRLVTAACFSD